jgi:hypothetical protein
MARSRPRPRPVLRTCGALHCSTTTTRLLIWQLLQVDDGAHSPSSSRRTRTNPGPHTPPLPRLLHAALPVSVGLQSPAHPSALLPAVGPQQTPCPAPPAKLCRSHNYRRVAVAAEAVADDRGNQVGAQQTTSAKISGEWNKDEATSSQRAWASDRLVPQSCRPTRSRICWVTPTSTLQRREWPNPCADSRPLPQTTLHSNNNPLLPLLPLPSSLHTLPQSPSPLLHSPALTS